MATGLVYIIGAGPGNPKLITLRGLECLRRADVVVYDRLGAARLLSQVGPWAEVIYAGKAAGRHALQQDEINDLLLCRAQEGKVVARLKGGDPFVFGRGGEEAEFLAEHGIPFEVVPGVTSAIAAPGYAGIPATHRSHASTLAIVTGHEDPAKARPGVNWSSLATGADTIVVMMGLAHLQAICRRLMANGRAPETPVALTRWGTCPEQQTITGTLGTIAEEAARAGLTPPVVIVIGETVRLREKLCWFEKRPLSGQRVAVVRPWTRGRNVAEMVEHLGAEVAEVLVSDGTEPAGGAELERSIRCLRENALLVFTSVAGVESFFDGLDALNLDARALAGARVAALGDATSAALRARRVRPDFGGEPSDLLKELFVEKRLHAVALAGKSAVACWIRMLAPDPVSPPGVTVACLDDETARAAQALGLAVHVVPAEPTAAHLAEGLVQALREREPPPEDGRR